MKPYLATTALIFGLITAAHLARIVVEPHVLREPFFLATTAVAIGLFAWGAHLLWRSRRA